MKKIVFLFLSLLFTGSLLAQDINVTLGNQTDVQPGEQVTLPLNVENFNGVGSFTFIVDYDDTKLTGGNAININPNVVDDALITFENGKFTIDWLGLAALNEGDTKILDLVFTYTGTAGDGQEDLVFNENSGVSDELGGALATNYTDGFVTPYPVLLTAPNGGEVWQGGGTQNITWETFNINQLNLEYSTNNGTNWISIENSVSADGGSYEWSVPNNATSEALVRISNTSNTAQNDQSDAVFTITEQPLINITSPNGGEEWLQGSTQNITWSSAAVTNVKIEYSTNNGTDWNEVVASVAASSGTYEWTVPETPTTEGLVRLTAVENGSVTDQSDAVFSILAPSITVTAPNGGETVVAGGATNIEWTSVGVTNVAIDYSDDNGSNWNSIEASTPSDGSYEWLVPTALSGSNLLVRISDVDDAGVNDVSDAQFTVASVSLTLNDFQDVNQGESLTFNLDGVNLLNVGAITIKMNFDNTNMTYDGFENLNSNISSATINEANGVVTLSWDNINGTTISDDKLADLNFTFNGTPGDGFQGLAFDQAETEIADIAGNALATSYDDGVVTPYPLLVTAPNGGEIWQVGDEENITWEAFNISSIDIEYSTNNGTNWNTIQAGVNAASGSLAWTVPDAPGAENLVRITQSARDGYSDVSDAAFTIAEEPTISITSPNGGEDYLVGSTHDITWNSVNVTNIKIELSTNNGTDWSTIEASVAASSGTYNWTVPNNPTEQALVRVTDVDNAAVTDVSNAVFTISLPSITLTSPNGGEVFIAGSQQEIEWTANGVFMFDVEYSSDNGSSWNMIDEGGTNQGFTWTVPDIDSEEMLVRVSDNENSSVTDVSDSVFSVKSVQLAIGTLDELSAGDEVLVPVTATDLLEVGAITLKIEFDPAVVEYVGIENLNGNLANPLVNAVNGVFTFAWDDLTGTSIEDDKMFDLKLVFNGTPADGEQAITFNASETEVSDVLGNVLSVSLDNGALYPVQVLVSSPNGGEIWEVGTTENIIYETYDITNVKIEYSTNNGTDWSDVIASTPATGSFAWEIPAPSTLNALVRVSDADNVEAEDVSDAVFTISAEGVIQVTQPNGGETLVSGETYGILWQSSAVDKINIEYSTNNGTDWNSVATDVNAVDGNYVWTVPAKETEEALVRLTSTNNPLVTDVSDAVFTIVNPFITLVAPNGGEEITAETTSEITYESAGLENVKLEYTTNNGIDWLVIEESTTADGSYNWTVPNTPTTEAKVKVTDVDNGTLTDESDAVFTILEPEVLSVSADDISGVPGTQVTMPVNVTAFNEIGAVTLRMEYNPLMLTFVEAQNINSEVESGILINEAVDGDAVLVSWTDNSPTFTGANIGNGKLFDLVFEYAGGTSEFTFNTSVSELANTLGEPLDAQYVDGSVTSSVNEYIVVLQPNGGETLLGNTNTMIKWASGGVNILQAEYTINNGTDWIFIADGIAAADGEYEWLLPNTSSDEVKVRLFDMNNASITDESDEVFSISLNASVALTSPNGGESWIAGTTENITWTQVGLNTVELEYSTNNGTDWIFIDDGVNASDGSYSWTVPDVNTDEALVRISTPDFAEIADVSDAVFTISIPLPLTVQAGDVSGAPGTQVTVPVDVFSFNGIGAITLRLEYNPLILSFVEAQNINSEVESGILINQAINGDAVLVSWTDASPTFTGANIGDGKLFDLVFDYVAGETDLNFNENISELADTEGNVLEATYVDGSVSSSVGNYLTLLSPNGGETFLGGDVEEIAWAQDGATELTIEYTIDDGGSYVLIDDNISASTETYNWTVPNLEESQVKIRITDQNNGSLTDMSDDFFAITQSASITVVVPNGGESYPAGTTQTITWNAIALSSFDIEFSSDNGATWETMVQDYSSNLNSKSQKKSGRGLEVVTSSNSRETFNYSWSVPLAISDECKIKVIDANNDNLFDISDAAFSITEPLEAKVILPEIIAEFGDSVTIPVVVENMVNVGAITLNVGYDPEVLQWGRAINFDPQLEGALANGVNGTLVVAWDGLDGFTQLNGTMVELKMLYIGGYSDLAINTTQTEFADTEGNIIEVMYTDGWVNSVEPTITSLVSPENGAVDVPIEVPFVWNSSSNTLEYQLQVATDDAFSSVVADSTVGDTTLTLTLGGDTEYFWRVKSINDAGMSDWTDAWSFTTAFSVSFVNLESPENAIIFKDDSVMVSGKVVIEGLTSGSGQGAGVTAYVGYNTSNTNPLSWSNWVEAAYVEDVEDADLYMAYIGSELPRGDYYYATRFEFEGDTFYGGYSESGGGFWDGTNNVSGMLSVVAEPIAAPTELMAFAPDFETVELNWVDNSDNETGFKIERKTGDSTSVEPFAVIDSVIADISVYQDTTVEPLTEYTYRVFAYNSDTVSAYSNLSEVSTPIPVELTSFTVSTGDNMITVTWKTATETNNKGFEVERKTDGDWESMQFIDGKGTTSEQQSYSFMDQFKDVAYNGTVYYRLKQMDYDGTENYIAETEVEVDFTPKTFEVAQNYPNPFNPTTTIKYQIPEASSVVVTIYNMLGQKVETLVDVVQETGYYEVNWSASGYASGMYFYHIQMKAVSGSNSHSSVKKMMLMK
ncbi:MAG: hypothetical protein SCALA702_22330 [Melioribacteraceae bacterium]|nr:MAG: hypothetical protein SCALA702_22330 [Melioribacteraceae bacterium]